MPASRKYSIVSPDAVQPFLTLLAYPRTLQTIRDTVSEHGPRTAQRTTPQGRRARAGHPGWAMGNLLVSGNGVLWGV